MQLATNGSFAEGLLDTRQSGFGRELPSWLISAPFDEVECLAAGDDHMIEGANFHQLQGIALWTGVCNKKGAAPISFFLELYGSCFALFR